MQIAPQRDEQVDLGRLEQTDHALRSFDVHGHLHRESERTTTTQLVNGSKAIRDRFGGSSQSKKQP
jgi:hypothetical protein